jgi:DNA-binding protein HU-beta
MPNDPGEGGFQVNKDELVAEVAKRADVAKASAAAVVEALTETIKTSVAKGQKVALIGFGTFEKRVRNARTARNPRTGATVQVPKTNVPAFKPGAAFKESVSGRKKASAKKSPAKKAGAKKATARKR